MTDRYINIFTDFGFKKIFGEEVNKDLLIDFLNELLKGEQSIKDLTYKKTEHLGSGDADRKAIFDLYCENEQGEKFIVELQKSKQNFFKDRSVYYSTFPIAEQGKRGIWNFELKAVYTIAILDFRFDDQDKDRTVVSNVQLMDTQKMKVFYDKLTFVYLQMPNFTKTEDELETKFDCWLYVLRNLHKLHDRPKRIRDRIFEKFFETAEISHFNPEEREEYEESLKYYRDLQNTLDTARDEGKIEKGFEVALNLIAMDFGDEQIGQATGLSINEVVKLRRKSNKQ